MEKKDQRKPEKTGRPASAVRPKNGWGRGDGAGKGRKERPNERGENVLERGVFVCIIMGMLNVKSLRMPIRDVRSDLCNLVKRLEPGVQIVLTNHGQPTAVLSSYRTEGKPWRAATPDDPALYGDLQSPVLEDWS